MLPIDWPITHPIRNAITVVTALSALFLAQTFWFASNHSLTYDETAYLNLSIQSVHDGRLDPNFPAMGIAPLPALLTYVAPLALSRADVAPSTHRWEARRDAPQLIRRPRFLNSILIGVPLVVTIFWWLWRRHGLPAAALGGGVAALSPTLIAHGAIATMDAGLALFGTLAMAAIAWFANAPGTGRLLVCAIAIAAVMTAKYSGVFLLPVASAVFLLSSIRRHSGRRGMALVRPVLRDVIVPSALLVVLTLPLWWAGHLFARVPPPDGSVSPRNLAQLADTLAPVAGLRYQLAHVKNGGEAFLAGQHSTDGWWYYFPLTFLIKSTPAELALAAVLAIALIAALRHPWRSLTRLDSSLQCLLLAASLLAWLLVNSRLNLGHRYMILMYPILIIASSDWIARRLRDKRVYLAAAIGSLLILQAVSSLTIAPHHFEYVNRFAGGPKNAWRMLADSDLDWGQDLPSLRRYLEQHADERVALKYFGSGRPEAYGVDVAEIRHLRAQPDAYTVLALSATYLNGLYMNGLDPFTELRKLEPDAQAGYSIMLYDLRRPEVLSAVREALKVHP